ncbi:MAG: DUF4263 domain-containing protein [Desulfobacterales bacterium]|nr:DUF4263 domain-containing protein [Desulfobacterales bacterium]
MTILKKTYELVKDAPSAISWEVYERDALKEWNKLISGPRADDERTIHEFLEQNPSFVPGAFSFPTSGHGPVFGGVFSKPPLTGIGIRIPDFMWLATATDIISPVFVEIETPAKRWFTKIGQPRAEWTQARNQIVTWKQWLNKVANKAVFLEYYGLSAEFRHFEIKPQFVLVYGRRKEFDEDPTFRGIRALQQGPDEFHITFDRLCPDYNARNFLTLRKDGEKVVATVVPPTILLGPGIAQLWLPVIGRPEAALSEFRMSRDRRLLQNVSHIGTSGQEVVHISIRPETVSRGAEQPLAL